MLAFFFFQEARYSEAVKHFEFDKHLGPYALDHFGEWKQLSSYITKDTIERIGTSLSGYMHLADFM